MKVIKGRKTRVTFDSGNTFEKKEKSQKNRSHPVSKKDQ